ncbi:alpha/beta fold hydrolase [Bordetella genomosp. 13]|uniref:alpha/beta fold hydrolase n=1 Tax=Bordetella genomosp. 13 TaxID=463040 RepID=UPI00119CAB92|nr:alpha/beta hydrolase [Bordetella genomosp. 13]
MSTIQTNDYRIQTDQGGLFVRRWSPGADGFGAEPPIVLLHDSLGCVELWRDFPAHLAAATGRDVIAYDRLGFGRSDPHPGTLPPLHFIRNEADEGFRSVREALALERFVLFGHSVGGGMAVACAARYPSACAGLISESAQMYAEDRTLNGIREAKQAFSDPVQVQRLAKYHGDKAEWVLHAWIDSWLAPEFASWSLDEELGQVRSPVLSLHGDTDEYGSVDHPARIASLAPGDVTVHILPACGHVPHREQEDVVLEHILAWPVIGRTAIAR